MEQQTEYHVQQQQQQQPEEAQEEMAVEAGRSQMYLAAVGEAALRIPPHVSRCAETLNPNPLSCKSLQIRPHVSHVSAVCFTCFTCLFVLEPCWQLGYAGDDVMM